MAQNIEGYVFIVTYGRSGSTLLQTVLQSINGYCIRGENNNSLMSLYESARAVAEARAEHGQRPMAGHEPWYGIDTIKPDGYAQGLVETFKRHVLQPPEGTRVLGFKEIRFHRAGPEHFGPFLDFIGRHMAPAKFIFNCRHWQDVAKSSWWRDCDEEMVRERVETSDQLYRDYAAAHPDQCFIAQYEDYAGNPDYWRGLFDFLGEPFDAELVRALSEKRLKHQ